MRADKVLLIGGTYFLGRAFTILYKNELSLSLLNRGNNPVGDPIVTEYRMDRRDPEALKNFPDEAFNAVIDFCAYEPGDVSSLLGAMKQKPAHYILISSVDVYRRDTGRFMTETDERESRVFNGEQGAYIKGKIAAECELEKCAAAYGIGYSLIRPAVIYGPGNYAPRENLYFERFLRDGCVYYDPAADGAFQMVYVADVARALRRILEDGPLNGALNLCGSGMLTQEDFLLALDEAVGEHIQRIPLSEAEAGEKGFSYPFVLRKSETQYYSDALARERGFTFVPPAEGLAKAYESYRRKFGI